MPLVRRLLIVASLALLVATTAYGAGWASRDSAPRPASAPAGTPVAPDTPDSPAPGPVTPVEPVEPAGPIEPTKPAEPVLRPGPALLSPGAEGPRVRDLQARLAQIDWFAADVTGVYGDLTEEAVRGFQAKREIPVTGEVDRRTLDRLHAMTREPTDAELTNTPAAPPTGENAPGALDARCLAGRVICVDKTTRTLRWVVDGEVRQTLDTRFGSSSTPTREGAFRVHGKSRDHVSSLYDTAMPYAMFFSGGQAVHYSPDFAAVGYAGASHGCVNVRDREGVAWLFDQVRVGDAVVVYWS